MLRVNGPDQEHLNRAAQLMKQLQDHTSLFPAGTEHLSRYLYVMVTRCIYRFVQRSFPSASAKASVPPVSFRTAWCRWTALRTSSSWPKTNTPRNEAVRQERVEKNDLSVESLILIIMDN